MHTMTITNARQGFLELPETIKDEPLFVTKHGKPVMTVLSMDQYEGMLETLEILRDQVFASRLKKSLEDASAGKTVSLEAAAKRLGLS